MSFAVLRAATVRTFALLAMAAAPYGAFAQAAGSPGAGAGPEPVAATSEPPGLELVNHCTIVGTSDAAGIIGFDVQAPDPTTQSAGICSFASSAITREGILTYSVVTTADVLTRRTYFRYLAVRCGSVDASAPNAAQCGTFRKLAFATSARDYYAARTGTPDSAAVAGLGDAAMSNATAVYVMRGDEVFECSVRVGDSLDTDRSTMLATLLLDRVAPLAAASPAPAKPN